MKRNVRRRAIIHSTVTRHRNTANGTTAPLQLGEAAQAASADTTLEAGIAEVAVTDPQPPPEPIAPSLAVPDPGVFVSTTPMNSARNQRLGHPNRDRLNLFILRHASAGTRRANPKLDVKRPLDKEGKQHCFHLAHALNGLKLSFDLIVSSPLKRCLQTAQLVGTELGYEAKILHADALRPGSDYGQFQRLIHECRSYENVLLVGHNPNLTYFLGELISGGGSSDHPATAARVRMRKGSLARVTVERGPGMLQWMLDPRIVRALYATSIKSSRRKTSRK